jgi:hypothetical protein
MSPKNLQLLSPSAGVHLAAGSDGFVPGNEPMLLLENPSHPHFIPLVECSKVGLPHPFGKLLHGEVRLLQPDWGFAF